MKKLNGYSKILNLMTALLLSAGVARVSADDTEIYVGSNSLSSDIKPNVVFIIDTSGSMDTDETVINGTYDSSTAYLGTCTSDKIYYSTNGSAPDCSTNNYILATSNTCKASATALSSTGTGYYNVRAARYKAGSSRGRGGSASDTWDNLSSSNHDDYVECADDWGVHGQTDASTTLYPADESDGGPWVSSSASGIRWSRTGDDYTFYNANYLNWINGTGVSTIKTRLEIVQEVFSNLMDSVSNINISVMRFDENGSGGYFIMPMAELTDSNRANYQTAVNNLTANGNTPLSETLYESYLFYKGAAQHFGDSSSPSTNVAGVLDGSNYQSPIEYQCQKNFVILLTDGDPTNDDEADSNIEGLSGFSAVTGAASCSGNCLDELADYMHSQDCSDLDSKQNVITYTIGFTTAQTLLSNAATKGGGKYFTASSYADLTDAFNSIITDIRSVNTSFIAPAVSVNSFNRFTHRDELYYALFRPELRPMWYGNIKRYKLDGNPPVIVDQDGAGAIDANTGFFKETAKSFWSSAVDGDVVENGGHASKLTTARTVYTYTGATSPADVNLTATDHALADSNTLVTKTLLGDASMSDTDRSNLLQWATGIDLLDEDTDGDETDARQRMGDPLHAKPILVTYGGTEASPDITLYAGTNEGFLHAVNTSNGEELFSFIPQELLPNLSQIYENSSSDSHPYGLDGPLTMWFNDVNKNGVILDGSNTVESGEHVYLYQAMRRGGKNYYALDVTDRSSPVLKWVIHGGSGAYHELAQTWSAASKGKIKLNGTDTDVLIFGGGYDADQDTNANATDDDEGRAIFIVNASTGDKIWQAGPANSGTDGTNDPDLVLSDMTNSIPADVNAIDMDFDGYIDRLYVGDMRGQVWRFDIDNANTGAGTLATGGVIARLGGSSPATNRRFYYKPDVSLSDDGRYLNIAIGSGYRAHPLNTVIHDAFFVIRDENVYGPARDGGGTPVYTTITLSGLYNATDNVIGEGTDAEIETARSSLQSLHGLYVYMSESDGSFVGEKVLAKSTTFSGKVMFTTYTPVASSSAACSPSQGAARVYYMSITDATPVIDGNVSGSDDLTRDDRRSDLVRGGIPPEPSVIFHENGPVVLIGSEKGPDPDIPLKPKKTHWYVE